MFELLAAGSARRPLRPLAFALGIHALLVFTAVEVRPEPVPPKRPSAADTIWLAPPAPPAPVTAPGEAARAQAGQAAVPPAPFPVTGVVPVPPPGPLDIGRVPLEFTTPALSGSKGASDRASGIAEGVAAVVGPETRRVEEGVVAPELLDPGAIERRLAMPGLVGSVMLRCVVGRDGRVIPGSIHVIDSTGAEVAAAARDALLRVRYRPGRMGGAPAAVEIRQRFTFTLRGI